MVRLLLSLFLLLVFSLAGCFNPSGRLGGDNDDDATSDDDDATSDDDDATSDDDDATSDSVVPGFFSWDVVPNENGTPGPTYGYLLLPFGSMSSCAEFGAEYGYDTDYEWSAAWIYKGSAAEWPGTYTDFYSDSCQPYSADGRCFAAWGYGGGPGDGFDSGIGDELEITNWTGELVMGSMTVDGKVTSFRVTNCGKSDFADYDGDTTPADDTAGSVDEERSEPKTSKKRRSWKLRFR